MEDLKKEQLPVPVLPARGARAGENRHSQQMPMLSSTCIVSVECAASYYQQVFLNTFIKQTLA
jgi:hypothetical protein